jgi:CTP synthase
LLHLDSLDAKSTTVMASKEKVLRSLVDWNEFAKKVDEAEVSDKIVIAFVGKYNKGGGDAYQSVLAALHHAAVAVGRKLHLDWIDATDLEEPKAAVIGADPSDEAKERIRNAEARLQAAHGIFVPGGFGDRGIEGKARAAGLARQWKKPYLGVCLGMQVAIIQFARDLLGLSDATSEEFDKNKHSKNHVLLFMPEISKETMGANMRLGTRWVEFPNPATSVGSALYGGASRVMERHRHRYEFNVEYKEQMEKKGLIFSGQDESKERMDIIELPLSEHPFYLGVQFHPEYKSRPGLPSPPFYGFMSAASNPAGVEQMLKTCRESQPHPHWVPFAI